MLQWTHGICHVRGKRLNFCTLFYHTWEVDVIPVLYIAVRTKMMGWNMLIRNCNGTITFNNYVKMVPKSDTKTRWEFYKWEIIKFWDAKCASLRHLWLFPLKKTSSADDIHSSIRASEYGPVDRSLRLNLLIHYQRNNYTSQFHACPPTFSDAWRWADILTGKVKT